MAPIEGHHGKLSDVVDVGFKQDVNEVPVCAEFTGDIPVAGVMVVRHDLLSDVGD